MNAIQSLGIACALAAIVPDTSSAQGSQRVYGYDVRGNRTSATNQIRFTSAAAFSIQPRRAVTGDTLNVYGRNFPAGQNGSVAVTLGGSAATILSVATRVITVEVPAGITSGLVEVSIGGGSPMVAGTMDVEAVEVSPSAIALDYGESIQLNANVIGAASPDVTWWVNDIAGGDSSVGTITAGGLYTAPLLGSGVDFPFLIAATSAELGIAGYAIVDLACLNPTPITDQAFASNTLSGPFERHCYTFTAQAFERAFIAFRGAGDIQSLKLRGPNGIVVAEVGPGTDLRIPDMLLPLTGEYHIEVQGQPPPAGLYSLWLDQHAPLPVGTWLYPADGVWDEAENWSQATLPGTTDDVVIGDFPDNITITIDQAAQSAASILSEERLTLAAGGALTVPGTLQVNNTFTLDGGTLSGANLLSGSGGQHLQVTAQPGNRLDGVSITGDLDLSAAGAVVRVANDLVLTGTAILGTGSSLAFEGSQTLQSGTVSFEGAGSTLEMHTAGTLTLGATTTVQGGGDIGANNYFAAVMDLVHEGTINADAASETLAVSAPTWSSSGTLQATAGTLQLGGTLDTTSVGTIDSTGGAVEIRGTLTNTGSALTLNGTAGSFTLDGGEVVGGTLNLSGGATLVLAANTGSRLDGVTVNGDLELPAAGAVVRVANDLTLNGTADLSGANSSLAFEGTQSLQAGTVAFSGAGSTLEMHTAGTLTLGASVVVQGGNGDIGTNNQFAAAMDLVSQGTISADTASQTLAVTAPTWTSSGTLQATAGTLQLGGTLDTTSVGTIDSTGGAVEILGAITNTGATTTLNGTAGSFTLDGGEIAGGTVSLTGGATLAVTGNTGNRLDGVTVNGDLDLSAASAVVRIANDLTLNGTADLSGAASSLAFEGTQTLQAGTVTFSGAGSTLEMHSAGTLTLGASVVVQGGNGDIGANNQFAAAMDLVHQGTISADTASQTLAITAPTWTSTGTLQATAGTLQIGGTLDTTGIGTVDSTGGSIDLVGTVTNTAGTLTLNGAAGSFTLDGGEVVGGAVTLTGGATLVLAANTGSRLDGVTVNGELDLSTAGAVLRIANDLTLNGTADLSGAASSLAFEGTQTLQAGTVAFSGAGSTLEMHSAGTLTLGASVVVQGGNGDIGANNQFAAAMDLVHQGTISADTASQTLAITAPTWSSSGTLQATAGTLQIGGTLDTTGIGTVDSTGGSIELLGTVTNTAGTLTLNGSAGSFTLDGGEVVGGTLTLTGGATLGLAANTNNRLDGVTLNGDLDLSAASAVVRIANDLTLNGTAVLSGVDSSLALEGTQTLQAGTVSFEGAGTDLGYLEMHTAGTLTLAAAVIVQGGNGVIGGSNQFAAAMDLVHQGTLSADISGQTLSVESTSFLSTGTVELQGGTLDVTALILQGGSLTGSGTINGPVVNEGGDVQPGGAEAGTITLNGDYTQTSGSLTLDVGGTVPDTEHDQLLVSGAAEFADTLQVNLIAFTPLLGQTFDLVTYGSQTGVFTTTNLPDPGGGLVLQVNYLLAALQLEVQ